MSRITYFKPDNYVSFLIVAYYHINELKKDFTIVEANVNRIDFEIYHKQYVTYTNTAIVHPFLYPIGSLKSDKYIFALSENFKNIIAIDTADSDKVSEDMAKYLDKTKFIIVPSEWAKKSYEQSGTKTPVGVVYHGLDRVFGRLKTQNFTIFGLKELNQSPKKKILYYWWHSEFRKGLDILEKSAQQIMKERDDVIFIQKSIGGACWLNIPNLVRYQGIWGYHKLVELYDVADLLILPSRGEGFGINGLEALARGVPLVYPDNSAMCEYADGYGYAVPSEPIDQPLPNNPIHVGKGHTITVEDLTNAIHHVLDNLSYYKDKAKKFPTHNWYWFKVCENLRKIVREYV